MQMIELLEKDIKAAFTKHYVKKVSEAFHVNERHRRHTPLQR